MATVDKNFKVKHGLIVEGTTATVNGEDVITTGSSTDNLPEGSTNQYYTTARAKGDAADLLTNATLTNITITGNEDGLTITAENGGIQDISGFDTDDLTEGSTNLYFTDQRAADAALAAATRDNTANTVVKRDGFGNAAIGQLDAETKLTAPDYRIGNAGKLHDNDGDLQLTANNSNTLQLNADSDIQVTAGTNVVLNPGVGSNAYVGAETAGNEIATKGYVDGLASNYDPAGAADTAEDNANSYTDFQLGNYTTTANLDTTIDGYGYLKSADLSGYATESYVGTAIDNLVDGAPGLLDTLNEIAAAIADDENYATTMTTALAGKQDSLTAGSNISIDASDVISVTGLQASDISDFGTAAQSANIGYYDPAGSASTAEQNAKDYADTVAQTAENNAKGYADATFVTPSSLSTTLGSYVPSTEKGATGGVATLDNTGNVPLDQLGNVPDAYITSVGTNLDVTAGELTVSATPAFTSVSVNEVAKQVAATASLLGTVPGTVYSFAWSDFTAAEFLIKVTDGTHAEISKVLLALDDANNIAITEYGIVGTNGSMSTITAVINGASVDVKVTPASAATVNVVGTLLA